ncbi:2OG-Fe(II) oxygenase [Psychrobacter lutiphocae]|uniref:2OG-Fe(II) oxygenase n=1 Tax=Psychrobacter lutiphocae TaxID=540500 RepID=UPI00035D0F1B|nr:2OG-Fe(II) oxygenase [Psychrobacter lutiphocae]
MSALRALEKDWQEWVKENIARGVSVNKLAVTLFNKGWIDAAYELINDNSNNLKAPHINTSHNYIQLSDKRVSISFTCYSPFVVSIDDFLSFDECQALISDADSKLKASRVVNPKDGSFIEHNARTSTSTGYQRGQTAVIKTIESRISELLHWPVDHGEGLQVLRYEDGGEYRPHFDFFDPAKKSSEVVTKKGGQRVGTFLMYLSDVGAGGATRFPKLNFEVRPKKGSALYFANTDLNGDINPLTLHAGMPVTEGVKYLSTKWLREKPYV